MGFGITDILYFRSMKIAWKDIEHVCDLGLQQIHCEAGYDYVLDFIQSCTESVILDVAEVKKYFSNGYMIDFWKACDKAYTALEVVGNRDFYFFDLNFDDVPNKLLNHFDLVCNAGTTEHVMNQHNAFKVIHELTRVGGYMYHALPFSGYHDHGLVNYNMKFFTLLARVNNYRLIDAYFSMGNENDGLQRSIVKLLNQKKDFVPPEKQKAEWIKANFKSVDAGIRIFFQKQKEAAFCVPVDVPSTRGFSVNQNGSLKQKSWPKPLKFLG